MSHLLINEPPIAFLPSLAVQVGVDAALVLQQIHYWLSNPKIGKTADGQKWVRNTLAEWQQDNFPFWSESKISRILSKLESDGFISSRDDLNHHGYDRTKWYTVHYGNLQNCKMQFAELQDAACENDGTIPETTTETTQRNIYIAPDPDEIAEIKTAVSLVVKTPLWDETKEQYDSAAWALYGWEANPEQISGFSEWWSKNGNYEGLPALKSLVNEWRNYITPSKTQETNGKVSEPVIVKDENGKPLVYVNNKLDKQATKEYNNGHDKQPTG
jgi:hypothetical protein